MERDQQQSIEEINRIIDEAKTPVQGSKAGGLGIAGPSDSDDLEADLDSEVDVSGDFAAPPWAFGVCLHKAVLCLNIYDVVHIV